MVTLFRRLMRRNARPTGEGGALVRLGEASALTQGQGRGSAEDKRRAYN